jgi:hypothetical protein
MNEEPDIPSSRKIPKIFNPFSNSVSMSFVGMGPGSHGRSQLDQKVTKRINTTTKDLSPQKEKCLFIDLIIKT